MYESVHKLTSIKNGSSHYHLLLTRNYLDAWLASREYEHSESAVFREIAVRALAAAAKLSILQTADWTGSIKIQIQLFGLIPSSSLMLVMGGLAAVIRF